MRLKKFAMLLPVLFCIYLCGCSTLVKLYADQRSEDTDYESGSIEVTNSLGEKYTVDYYETGGFPTRRMTVKIYQTNVLISNSSVKFELCYIPNQILYLFTDGGKDYYYIAGNYYYDSNKTKVFWANIVTRDFWGNDTSISLDPSSERCVSLSKTLRKNIKRDELIKMFDKCEFNYDKIISVYDL